MSHVEQTKNITIEPRCQVRLEDPRDWHVVEVTCGRCGRRAKVISSHAEAHVSELCQAVGSGAAVRLPGMRQSGGQHVAHSDAFAQGVIIGGKGTDPIFAHRYSLRQSGWPSRGCTCTFGGPLTPNGSPGPLRRPWRRLPGQQQLSFLFGERRAQISAYLTVLRIHRSQFN